MDTKEKRFSIRDFAKCAADQRNPWTAAIIACALKHLAGEEAFKAMVELKHLMDRDAAKRRVDMAKVLCTLRPGYDEEEARKWLATKTPEQLHALRLHPDYIEAEQKFRSQFS